MISGFPATSKKTLWNNSSASIAFIISFFSIDSSKALLLNSNSWISASLSNGTAKRAANECKAATTVNACFASSRFNGATRVTEPGIDSTSPSSSRRLLTLGHLSVAPVASLM